MTGHIYVVALLHVNVMWLFSKCLAERLFLWWWQMISRCSVGQDSLRQVSEQDLLHNISLNVM